MELFLNKNIKTHLKNNKVIDGLLLDIDDNYVYIQSNKTYIIPIKNVLFYSIDENVNNIEQTPNIKNIINVSINGAFLTKIITPPELNLLSANEDVIKLIYANSNVQEALHNRVQKALEYAPGEANIILLEESVEKIESVQDNNEDSFDMNKTASPAYNYLSPTEMAQRLSNISKKGKKNE
jgi:hypothetical protein